MWKRWPSAVMLGCVAFLSSSAAGNAQGWRWRDDGFVEQVPPTRGRGARERETLPWVWTVPGPPRGSAYAPDRPLDPRGSPNDIRDGGDRPAIVPVAPPVVAFPHQYPANSIIIDIAERRLYFVLPQSKAFAYQISVGREGFGWKGTEVVSRKQAWPDWHPPAEMRARDPNLPVKMSGGLLNPLGAMALYLGTTLYRIHGTNDEKSLGQAQSSGCFRMMNAAVLHLAEIAEIGTTVHVVDALNPQRLSRAGRPQTPIQPPALAQPLPQPQPLPRAETRNAAPPQLPRGYDRNWDRWPPDYYRSPPNAWR